MKIKLLEFIECKKCKNSFSIKNILNSNQDDIIEGAIECKSCLNEYKIITGIPRFVDFNNNYLDNFSFQWKLFNKTQLDDYWGSDISKKRFFKETSWNYDCENQIILEAGCGMGRFTEHAASTKAEILSFDYSDAIEIAYQNFNHLKNVHFIQADIMNPPFKNKQFDKIFCFGVLQHCEKPNIAFSKLIPLLKDNSSLVADIYKKTWHPFNNYYYLRLLTKNINPKKLFPFVKKYFNFCYFINTFFYYISHKISSRVALLLGIADYRGYVPIKNPKIMKELCLLDTFDRLSAKYDFPQTIKSVKSWFKTDNFHKKIEIKTGYNGIEIHYRN